MLLQIIKCLSQHEQLNNLLQKLRILIYSMNSWEAFHLVASNHQMLIATWAIKWFITKLQILIYNMSSWMALHLVTKSCGFKSSNVNCNVSNWMVYYKNREFLFTAWVAEWLFRNVHTSQWHNFDLVVL